MFLSAQAAQLLALAWYCLHGPETPHRCYCHFLNDLKKQKADFYLRALGWLHRTVHSLMVPSFQRVGDKIRSLKQGFHLSTASNGPTMGESQHDQDDNAHKRDRVNTV